MFKKLRRKYYYRMEGVNTNNAMLMIYLANQADSIKKRKKRLEDAASYLNKAYGYLDKQVRLEQ